MLPGNVQLIVTRPEPDASAWVARLAARGVSALALPLIDIRPARDPAALAALWARLDRFQAVMFVSAQAVAHFFAARPATAVDGEAGAAWRAWATGPGTAQALLKAGVPPGRIDAPAQDAAQMDSEALWAEVRVQCPAGEAASQGRQVLIVRGSDAQGRMAGRDWLAQQLQAQGVAVAFAVAYERHLPHWTPAQQAWARAAAAQAHPAPVWLFSSSEAVANLRQLLPGQDWSAARALATHPRIAQSVRQSGFGVVYESRPGLEAIMASIKSAG